MKKYKIQHWLRDMLLALVGLTIALPILKMELTKWIKARRKKDDTVNNPATKKNTWDDDMRKEFNKHMKNNNK